MTAIPNKPANQLKSSSILVATLLATTMAYTPVNAEIVAKSGVVFFGADGSQSIDGITAKPGEVYVFKHGEVADHAQVTVNKDAALIVNKSETIGSLGGSGSLTLDNATLTTGGNDADSEFSGNISGTGNLHKEGKGNFLLSGLNSIVGDVVVIEGSLSLQGTQPVAEQASLTVEQDGTLALDNDLTVKSLSITGGKIEGDVQINTTYFSQTSVDDLVKPKITAQNTVKAVDGKITQNNENGIEFETASVNDVNIELNTDISTPSIGMGAIKGNGSGTKVTFKSNAKITGTINIAGADKATSTFTNNGMWNAAGGSSSFEGSLINNGTISLQNGQATDKVKVAALVLNADSMLKLDIDKDENADMLIASDNVTIGGGLDIVAAGAITDYMANKNYKYILIENMGVNPIVGEFDKITDNFAFLNPKVEINADGNNDVTLKFHIDPSVASGDKLDFKQFSDKTTQAAATSLDGFDYTSEEGKEIHKSLIGVTESQAKMALKQVSGADLGASKSLNSHISPAFQNSMMKRAAAAGGGDITAAGYAADSEATAQTMSNAQMAKHVWADVLLTRSSIKASTGFDSISAFSAGMAFGAEITGGENWAVGASTGYITTFFSTLTQGSNSKSNSVNVGLYGNWGNVAADKAGLGVSSAVHYSRHHYKSNRVINAGGLNSTANADYYGSTYGGEVKIRYGIDKTISDTELVIAPFIGAGISRSQQNGYTETGAGAFNITASGQALTKFNSLFGVEASNKFNIADTMVNGTLSAAWKHEFGNVSSTSNYKLAGATNSFAANSATEARNSLLLQADLGFMISKNSFLTLSANADISRTNTNLGAKVSLKMKF